MISTDPDYSLDDVIDFFRHIDPPDPSPYTSNTNTQILSYEIEPVLRKLKNTAPGCDNLPAWLFKKCSVELADVVAKLLSKSYAVGKVYANWKLAVVTSVPKIANSTSFNDFRPISVTPILSRVAEKILVRD